MLRGGHAVDKSQVEVRGGLQNPFGPGAGMLRALALVSVRQEKHKGCSQSPFRPGGGDKLIQHDLSAIHKVAAYCASQITRSRASYVVAELEADSGALRQRTVVDLE